MKFEAMDIFNCKYALRRISKDVFLLPFTLLIVILVLLPLLRNINESYSNLYASTSSSLETTETEPRRRCNIFSGSWIPYPGGPNYYSNETCPFMLEKQNCIKSGRPDREFLQWKWKPHDCELPLFDATQFLKLVQGKSVAFVGDSMGRNQLESLLCLLNTVAHIEDITARHTYWENIYFRWWSSADYNFTLTILWSPFLVKSSKTYLKGGPVFDSFENLYLDEADEAWVTQIEKFQFDYVIISTGQWFHRPLVFYENGKVVGCQRCQKNMTDELNLYGYKKAFRTAFRTIINLKGFKGLTFLVTHSPRHFENGDWDTGGSCVRTKPFFAKEEMQMRVYRYGKLMEAHQIQMEEFAAAEKEARKKGLQFGLIDITNMMVMRPDGHPNRYGQAKDNNVTVNDCVHWCMPGPIDTWNEFLLYSMLEYI